MGRHSEGIGNRGMSSVPCGRPYIPTRHAATLFRSFLRIAVAEVGCGLYRSGMTFQGALLDSIRDNAGKTKTDLGAAAGVSERTIHNWIRGNGEPSGTQAIALANLLSCQVTDFYAREVKA